MLEGLWVHGSAAGLEGKRHHFVRGFGSFFRIRLPVWGSRFGTGCSVLGVSGLRVWGLWVRFGVYGFGILEMGVNGLGSVACLGFRVRS